MHSGKCAVSYFYFVLSSFIQLEYRMVFYCCCWCDGVFVICAVLYRCTNGFSILFVAFIAWLFASCTFRFFSSCTQFRRSMVFSVAICVCASVVFSYSCACLIINIQNMDNRSTCCCCCCLCKLLSINSNGFYDLIASTSIFQRSMKIGSPAIV